MPPLPPGASGRPVAPDEVVHSGDTTVERQASTGTATGLHVPADLRAKIKDIPSLPGYEVLGVIAAGGMGYVLHARDATLQRPVAIKLPLGQQAQDDRERFLREARSAASLRHPNICQIHRVDVTADGTPFIAMEYLDGQTLRDRIRDQRLSPHGTAVLLAAVARAVAYAHEKGIIHRDLKPQNVIVLNGTNQPVLTDFGLAKQLGGDTAQVTHTGQVMGTPSYMPPEQAAGRIEDVGPLADVYSLGAVLYQMLTGEPPFSGPVGEVLKRVQADEPVPPHKRGANVHRDLETICLKCLEKHPDKRYQSAAELAEDLERFTRGEPIHARRAGFATRTGRFVRRNRAVIRAAAAVFVVIGAAAGVVIQLVKQDANKLVKQADEQAGIRDKFRQDEWSAVKLQEIEAEINDLATRDEARAQALRAELNEAVFRTGQAKLQQAALSDTDRGYVNRVVELLQTRDESLAGALRKASQDRLRGWESVLRFDAKQRDTLAAFDPLRGGEATLYPDPDRATFLKSFGQGTLPVHLTSVACQGNSEVEVTFSPAWERHDRVGAVVNYPLEQQIGGYAIRLRPSQFPTFAEARAGGAPPRVELMRGDVVVRSQELNWARLPRGPLTVTIQRIGDRVLGQVRGSPPVVYQDLFPLSGGGVYGVVGPAGAEVVAVEGRRQKASSVASPLERGDELFMASDYVAALAYYREQARASAGTDHAVQARFKAGVCLMQLGRLDEAREWLKELYEQGLKTWSPLAGCYLVVAHVRRKEVEQANQLLDRLVVSQFTADDQDARNDLTSRLPEDVREEMLLSYRQSAQGLSWLRDDPTRVTKIERLMRAEESLGLRLEYLGWTRMTYVRALRATGNPADLSQAARSLREWLAKDYLPGDTTNPFSVLLSAEYGWLMREMGTPKAAFDVIEPRVFVASGLYRPDGYQLLIERARTHIAVNELEAAKADLTEFLRNCPPELRSYRPVVDASLMLGLLLEREGRTTEAMKVWSEALPKKSLGDPSITSETAGGIGALNLIALQLLTGTLKDDEFEDVVRNMLKTQQGGELVLVLLKKEDIQTAANQMRAAIRKSEGREQLRQFAFQTGSFREYGRRPVTFAVSESVRELAFGGKTTPEQEAVLGGLVADGVQAFGENRLGRTQLVQLALTAQGSRDFLNWGRLEKTLAPPFRGPLAYVLGHRFLRLGKTADAGAFFRTAAADAPTGSSLKKLAESELSKLSEKK